MDTDNTGTISQDHHRDKCQRTTGRHKLLLFKELYHNLQQGSNVHTKTHGHVDVINFITNFILFTIQLQIYSAFKIPP